MSLIRVSKETKTRLTKFKAALTAQDGKTRTFDEAIQELLGPIYVHDIPEENVEEFIRNMEELTSWLKYVPGESKSGKEGYVGMYYYVHREDASFPRSRP